MMHEGRVSMNKQSDSFLGCVDFCKGIAILMVILVHFAQVFSMPSILHIIPKFCQMGCQMFLILSAFTLCLSYSKKQPKYKDFIFSRIHRIWFTYVCAIVVFVGIAVLSKKLLGDNILNSSKNPADILINVFLLNGLVPTTANNRVVRGGWFVGTIVLFYVIFPVMYKLYFRLKKRSAYWLYFFPLIVTGVCFAANYIISIYYDGWIDNNSFGYFFILNQLPALSIGFSVFDLYLNRDIEKIKLPIIKFLFLIVVSMVLFRKGYKYVFIILPFLCGLAFMYFLIFFFKKEQVWNDKKGWRIISEFGKASFGIYLTHSIVVYEFTRYMKKIVSKGFSYVFDIRVNEILLFALLLPIAIVGSYALGKCFLKATSKMQRIFDGLLSKIKIFLNESLGEV